MEMKTKLLVGIGREDHCCRLNTQTLPTNRRGVQIALDDRSGVQITSGDCEVCEL